MQEEKTLSGNNIRITDGNAVTLEADQRLYWYWLLTIDGITPKEISELLEEYSDPEMVFKYCDPSRLSPGFAAAFSASKRDFDCIRVSYEKLDEKGIKLVLRGDTDYPERLMDIPEEPYGFFLLGQMPDPEKISVAIVGARRATQHGRWMAAKLSESLGRYGVNIISGMAEGIDGSSHLGALNADGYTLAVLGNGVDICYPRAHHGLYEQIKLKGGILSEYGPGTPGLAYRFPARNRIISAMSDVVIVVEAKEHSGSLITVSKALAQGREVMAVPGRPDDPCSLACNKLIKEGAGCCTCAEDVLEYLQVSPSFKRSPAFAAGNTGKSTHRNKKRGGTGCDNLSLTVQEALVLSVLSGEPKHIETISAETGIAPSQLNALLIKMQIKGYLAGITNGMYSRK